MVAVSHLDVFPNGFRVNVVMLLNPHREPDIRTRMHQGPRQMVRIGVRFADGRVGVARSGVAISMCQRTARAFRRSPLSASEVVGAEAIADGVLVPGCSHCHPMALSRSSWRSRLLPPANSVPSSTDPPFVRPPSEPGSSGPDNPDGILSGCCKGTISVAGSATGHRSPNQILCWSSRGLPNLTLSGAKFTDPSTSRERSLPDDIEGSYTGRSVYGSVEISRRSTPRYLTGPAIDRCSSAAEAMHHWSWLRPGPRYARPRGVPLLPP